MKGKVLISIPKEEEERLLQKLYGYKQREDCAEGD